MTLRFTEGFDTYNTGADVVTEGRCYFMDNSGSWDSNQAGRFTGRALSHDLSIANQRAFFKTESTDDTQVLGFAFKHESTGTDSVGIAYAMCGFSNVGVYQTFFNVKFDGTIRVYNGDTAVLGTTTFALSAQTWYYIEVKVKFSSTVGTVDIQVDGVNVLSLTGLDTVDNSSTGNSASSFFFQSNPDFGKERDFDDVYLLDSLGTTNNDFLGDVTIETILPSADSSVAWSRSGGSTNAENVDEALRDDDTTYVHSLTSTQKDLYDFANITLTDNDTVYGINVIAYARKEAAGLRQITLETKSSTDEQSSSTITVGSDYHLKWEIFETTDGTVDWTPTLVDAAQFGIKVV